MTGTDVICAHVLTCMLVLVRGAVGVRYVNEAYQWSVLAVCVTPPPALTSPSVSG